MQAPKTNSQSFYLGENLDIKDKKGMWLNGQVIGIESNTLHIHYTGYHPKFDQYVPISPLRILKQWQPGKKIQVNNRLDAYHPIGGWLEARILYLEQNNNGQPTRAKVHFFNYHPKYDMIVNLADKNQVATIGSKSKGYGIGKRKRNINKAKILSELAKKLLKQKVQKLVYQLNNHDYEMKEIGGDGNCLFRAISDQLYGEETFHQQIRSLCMRYILHEKNFFQNFIVEDIEDYVERKSKDGVWGDDIQIQAISEIYARPVQIYVSGIKPIRTFHQENEQNVAPLKLAYIGYCHYNSIKKRQSLNEGILRNQFGEYQRFFLQNVVNKQTTSENATNKNRDNFSHFNPLEQVIQERIEAQTQQKDNVGQIQADIVEKIMSLSETQHLQKQIQAAELRQIQNRIDQENIQKQLQRIQEKQMQEVRKMSLQQSISNPHNNSPNRPGWFGDLLCMGFTEEQILFAIEIKGYDSEAVQNFLFDNM